MKKGSLSYCGGNDSGDSGSEEGMTQGKNKFVDGGTELSLWTFQELHVAFYTMMSVHFGIKGVYSNAPTNL